MTRRTGAEAFADAARAMTRSVHVGDILADLLGDCVSALDAEAVAILVTDEHGRLGLLSSSSAEAAQLEMLQAQDQQGPCVDSVRSGEAVSARGADELVHRWGHVGTAIVDAGFASVDAVPLVWHGRALGGLNIFRAAAPDPDPDVDALARAFADVACIVLLHSVDLPADQVAARVYEAMMARSTVEQAKGVLAELEGLDMQSAARRLHTIARAEGLALTEAATVVVRRAHERTS